jgi:hypothetical protein
MIDPGATVTVIDQRVRQALNLVPFRILRASLPNAPAPVRVLAYKVDLFILYAGGYGYRVASLSVFEMTLAHTGADALIGCDVLRECQFDHHGSAGTFSLAFSQPTLCNKTARPAMSPRTFERLNYKALQSPPA